MLESLASPPESSALGNSAAEYSSIVAETTGLRFCCLVFGIAVISVVLDLGQSRTFFAPDDVPYLGLDRTP